MDIVKYRIDTRWKKEKQKIVANFSSSLFEVVVVKRMNFCLDKISQSRNRQTDTEIQGNIPWIIFFIQRALIIYNHLTLTNTQQKFIHHLNWTNKKRRIFLMHLKNHKTYTHTLVVFFFCFCYKKRDNNENTHIMKKTKKKNYSNYTTHHQSNTNSHSHSLTEEEKKLISFVRSKKRRDTTEYNNKRKRSKRETIEYGIPVPDSTHIYSSIILNTKQERKGWIYIHLPSFCVNIEKKKYQKTSFFLFHIHKQTQFN